MNKIIPTHRSRLNDFIVDGADPLFTNIAQIPADDGAFSAFWLFSDDPNGGPEIDIFETPGYLNNEIRLNGTNDTPVET